MIRSRKGDRITPTVSQGSLASSYRFSFHHNSATLKCAALTHPRSPSLSVVLLCISPSAPQQQYRPSDGSGRKARPASALAPSLAKARRKAYALRRKTSHTAAQGATARRTPRAKARPSALSVALLGSFTISCSSHFPGATMRESAATPAWHLIVTI